AASPSPSPLIPIIYSHTYTTAAPHLQYYQSVTHSFPRDGGCTPLLPFRPPTINPTKAPIYWSRSPFHSTTCKMPLAQLFSFDNDPFSWVGCTPPSLPTVHSS